MASTRCSGDSAVAATAPPSRAETVRREDLIEDGLVLRADTVEDADLGAGSQA